MPRSSRHRSYRSRRHSVDRSGSEDEEHFRERKSREEEPDAKLGGRVSRDLDAEKRSSSHNLDGKGMSGAGNGDSSDDHGKKRKERVEELAVSDRWVSGEEFDHKKSKRDDSERVLVDSEKSKFLPSNSSYRSSRRHESSGEMNEDGATKVELSKSRSDRYDKDSASQYKDSKESDKERGSERNREREGFGSQNKDFKDRERERPSDWNREDRGRERGSEDRRRDIEVQNSSDKKVNDMLMKKQGSKLFDNDDDTDTRKDSKYYERQGEDLPNSAMGIELEKQSRKQLDSEDKRLGDGRDKDDKRTSARDDKRLGTYSEDRYEDKRSRDHVDNLDRDKRHRGDKSRDENPRDRASVRSDRKYSRDENSPVNGHYRKSNRHDSDRYGSYADDSDGRYKESRGQKRSFEDNDDLGDLRSRGGRGLREETEKLAVSSTKSESITAYLKSDYRHSGKRDSTPRNSHWNASSTLSVDAVKENNRDPSKLAESVSNEMLQERVISNVASASGATSTRVHERWTGSWHEKTRSSNDGDFDDVCSDIIASAKYERAPKSDSRTSPGWLEKKTSSENVHRFSDRTGSRHSLEADGEEKSGSKNGAQEELFLEKAVASEVVPAEINNRERTPINSAFNRTGRSYGASPGRLPAPIRHGVDNSSVFGLFEDESSQVGDRRPYNRNKRGSDNSFGWGQGNAWKGSGPSWPPQANGFIPLPHRPPPAAFLPVMPQFPASPFFGVRPSMDLSPNGVPFHMSNVGENFSRHGQQFGWHNTVDQACPPHIQMWDGNNGAFRDESHIYGRPDWEPNKHLIGGGRWTMGGGVWNTKNNESELPPHHAADEDLVELHSKSSDHEIAFPEAISSKVSRDPPIANKETEVTLQKKPLRLGKASGELDVNFVSYYLSKIDVSPDLADIELYKKCTSVCAAAESNTESSPIVHVSMQNTDSRGKMIQGSKNKILGSSFLKSKGAIFEKAIALYGKQNEKSRNKPKASPEVSSVEKKVCPENPGGLKMQKGSDAETTQGGRNEASLPLADLSDIMEARNISDDTNAAKPVEHESCSNSDALISDSGFQANEVLMEDCSANVNWIHHSPENTR